MAQDRSSLVCVTRSRRPDYGPVEPVDAPELPSGAAQTVAAAALRNLLLSWGLDAARAGTPAWNPLGRWIAPGSTVTVKPNWVSHDNQSGMGMDCLVTHTSLIEAILEYVALAKPAAVHVGDAPVQGCDFDALGRCCRFEALRSRFSNRGFALRIVDFRRTVLREDRAVREQERRPLDQYVLYDLARESLLTPLDRDARLFRVTMYHPGRLARTHAPGVHQYLVAREVVEAGVVINVPKLKCHKKACITGALKNLVGINGNKEFLPHHRKGGASDGGDCYAGSSPWKRLAEGMLDKANRLEPGAPQRAMFSLSARLAAVAEKLGGDRNLEGSWYGNDTIWRTCLDLQRILAYGALDGTLRPQRQRTVLHITDAIIGGEGEGPLAPSPVPSGFLTGAENCAAAEWVHARLMGMDPRKIPLIREAFGTFSYPLADFTPEQISVLLDGDPWPMERVAPFGGRAFRPPSGWLGHCELAYDHEPHTQPSVVA